MEYAPAVQQHQAIIEPLAALQGENDCDNIPTMFRECSSMERQRLLALHFGIARGYATTLIRN